VQLPRMLKDYSKFLAGYQGGSGGGVEVPGQYRGWARPDPSRHVKIASFEPSVLPFAPLRRPIRVGMVGEDGRTYRWIVKAGEDLRQDHRVEQLFQIANDILARRPGNRGTLATTTYTVLPLSAELGLIEFVPHTMPLKEVLGTVEGGMEGMARATAEYKNGLEKLTGERNPGQACLATWKVEEERVRGNYEGVVARTDTHLLRKALVNLSSSHEGFYTVRRNFVESFAVVSALQWLLGIGDRHLSNYLLDLATGRLVTIDFGYSFGVATSFLPVPELVPLRLTPQLVGVMAPLGTAGPFREVLVQVIDRVRAEPEVFTAALETFVQEPTLDWGALARKEAGRGGGQGGADLAAFTRGRVDMAREKLGGGNPASIAARSPHDPSYSATV